MSWAVTASGTPEAARAALEEQFAWPLAVKPNGLDDDGERDTVAMVRDSIFQCLKTFGADKQVSVSASGHIGWDDYTTKTSCYQYVNLSIGPVASK